MEVALTIAGGAMVGKARGMTRYVSRAELNCFRFVAADFGDFASLQPTLLNSGRSS